jgi:peroxiredoxin (alkyl hydroperoxide reductase subunit C)
LLISPVPLPGQHAINFELPAVVGDEIKNVNFAMASNPSGAVSRAYGVWNEKTGLNQRGRFIIDPDGVVMGVEVLAGPIGRNTEELLRQIAAMQAVRANPGMAAPAGWKPGDPLIKTGKEQIGVY